MLANNDLRVDAQLARPTQNLDHPPSRRHAPARIAHHFNIHHRAVQLFHPRNAPPANAPLIRAAETEFLRQSPGQLHTRRNLDRMLHAIEIPPGMELTGGLAKKLGFSGADERSVRGRRIPRMEELDGAVVNVEVVRYPRGGMAPTGRVIEILGRPGELGVDTEIIIRKHHLPHVFPAEVIKEAEHRALPVQEAELAGREDFRRLPIVTIDGETARDFDDAVYVERRVDGGWHLQVHIADVSHYVRTLTALDGEARLRGTSVYFPDRAVPMLPEALSNGMCSLKPREDRLVMSAL